MNLNKFFYDWSNEVYVDRNNLVFEGKNQAYGAYQIRQDYNKALTKSMFVAFLGIGMLVSIPSIVQYFKHSPVVATTLPPDDGMIPLDPELFKEMPIIPPQKTLAPVQHQNVSTVANIIPVVINEHITIDDKFAVNENLLNNNVGPETKVGEKFDDEVLIENKRFAEEEKPETPVIFAEKMPCFVGGDEELFSFMRSHVNYPEIEKEMGISGTVYVSFIVNKQGRIEDAKVVRGVKGGKGLENEALRVIMSMPAWEPGMQNMRPVKVQFTYPVNFVLK